MIETDGLPIIDVHCHPFGNPGRLEPDAFVDLASFPGSDVSYLTEAGVAEATAAFEVRRAKRAPVFMRYFVHVLADFFGVEPEIGAVMAARSSAITNYDDYLRRLFLRAGIDTLIADFGIPQSSLDRERFSAEVPATVVPIFRIEPLITELLRGEAGWEEFRRTYDETIVSAFKDGFRGLKSIIAYRTGLRVSPESRDEAAGRKALDAVRRGGRGDAMKALRDHLFCRAMDRCVEHDLPIQIHTGAGDHEVNRANCRPGLLMDLLRFPAYRSARVLLVHGGFPYHGEAGYMAQMLPRVYCDLSEGIPFAAHAAPRIIAEVLEMAPISKVVYGSDAFSLPEQNYAGAMLGRRALGQALTTIMEAGMLSREEAQEAAGQILAGNARDLYRLTV